MRERRQPKLPKLLLVAAVVLLCLAVVFARGPLTALLQQVVAPVLGIRNHLSQGDLARAQASLAAAEAKLADRDTLYAENIELKRLLGRAAGRSVLLAGVLERPPGVPYDTLLIDAGANQGVVRGSFVSMGGSALVGTVDEVYADTARVVLFSAAGHTHQGTLTAQGKAVPVSVAGQGGGSMRAEVPAGTGAKAGDMVVLPGVGLGLTAAVAHVESRAGESFETIYFALPASLNARFVELWQ